MKKCLVSIIALLLLFSGCTKIENIEIPEMTPQPAKEDEQPVLPQPTPAVEPDISNIDVPATLEELSEKIGMSVYLPATAPEGYKITEIGYDGGVTAALKYASDNAALLYTFSPTREDIPKNSEEITAFGLETYFLKTDASSMIQWFRGERTYQIIAEPALEEDALKSFMKTMLEGPGAGAGDLYIDCDDISELNKKLGFDIREPSYLPQNTTLSEVQCYKLYTGVLKYISEYDMLTFCVCEGDVTPLLFDADKYEKSAKKSVGDITAVYYTDGKGKVMLAQWYAGGYTHQIFSETGIKEDTMEMMIIGFSK